MIAAVARLILHIMNKVSTMLSRCLPLLPARRRRLRVIRVRGRAMAARRVVGVVTQRKIERVAVARMRLHE